MVGRGALSSCAQLQQNSRKWHICLHRPKKNTTFLNLVYSLFKGWDTNWVIQCILHIYVHLALVTTVKRESPVISASCS